MGQKRVYFLSDAHLGSLAIAHDRMRERRMVRFLDEIKDHASAVYLLGDIFDFWHEYKYVVPKGYTRLLGKISELTDGGVEVHFMTGNHDLWCRDYFEKECGMVLHRGPLTTDILGKVFFLAHGDGLVASQRRYNLLRSVFHNRTCQRLFAAIHPRWGMQFGLEWAKHSRLKHMHQEGCPIDPQRSGLVGFARGYLATHPEINFFIFGHRHVAFEMRLAEQTEMIIVGEWIKSCTYAVFDGEELKMESYLEGETKP